MRKEKKSETLEVRLTLSEKTAFATRASARAETMSAALRRMIAEDGVPRQIAKEAPMWKKMSIAGTPVVLTSVILIGVSLPGAQARTDFKNLFRSMDTNGDRYVDRDEMRATMAQRAKAVDLPPECDGTELARKWSLTPDELADGEIAFADADKDGRLTLREIVAANERHRASNFIEVDTDSNGYLTLAETEAGFRADEVKVSAECRAAVGMYGAATARDVLLQLDTDGDGQISLREFVDH